MTSHAFFRMLGAVRKNAEENKLYKDLADLIEKTDLYDQVYEKYKTVYTKEDRLNRTKVADKRKIVEEALGQALATIMASKWDTGKVAKKDKGFFDKLKDWFFSILDKFNKIDDNIYDSLF